MKNMTGRRFGDGGEVDVEGEGEGEVEVEVEAEALDGANTFRKRQSSETVKRVLGFMVQSVGLPGRHIGPNYIVVSDSKRSPY
jgi:hypothetical protein